MPTALPPIPSDQWDQHVETTAQQGAAADLAAIDQAQAAQQSAEQHRLANDARDEADAQQRAQSQIEAIGIAQSRNQEEVATQQRVAAQIDAIRPPTVPQAPAMPQITGVFPQITGENRSFSGGSAGTDVGGTDWRAYAAQAAQTAGIDPALFQRQIQQESGFDPNAGSAAGARGIAQIVPSAHPGVNPLDPKASLDYAANWMRQLTDRYGGDVRKALAAYNAGPGAVDTYGGVPPFEETQRYVKTIYDDAGGQTDALSAPPLPRTDRGSQGQIGTVGGGGQGQIGTPRRVEAVGQFEQGLPAEDAYSICGPVAALAFAQANGRNPDLAEARALAKQVGWTTTGGMNGVQNEQALLTKMGVTSKLDTNPDFGRIAADAQSGNPVIISTPVHYYYASNYDPNTGKLYVGKTGQARRGGGSWMTPQEIATLDGGINGALFVDNPQSPTPSVGASGDTGGDRPPSEFEQPSQFQGDRYLGRRPDQPITMGDVGDPTVAAGLPRTPLAALDAGATAVEGQIARSNQGFGDDLAASGDYLRSVQHGGTATPEQEARAWETPQNLAMSLSGEPLAAVGTAGRAALGLERAATTRQGGMSLETTGGPGGPAERLQSAVDAAASGAAGQVERLRLDKFPEDVRSTIQEAAGRGDFWQRQRRNVIPDAEAERMADELGRTVEQMVAGGRAGRAYNTEETRALRNGLVGQALKVDDLKATVEALGGQASDALKRQLGEEQSRLLALSRVAEGARAEAGRTFRAYLVDTRGRMLRARDPQYTNVSTVPITAAPELERPVAQGTLIDPLAHYRGPTDAGAQPGPLRTLGNEVAQGTLVDPLSYYRGPTDPGAPAGPLGTGTDVRVPSSARQATLPGAADVPAGTRQVDLRGTPIPPAPGAAGPSLYDRFQTVRFAGMLSSTATQILNNTANAVNTLADIGLKPVQALIDAGVSAGSRRVTVGRGGVSIGPAESERTRYLAEVAPQAKAFLAGMITGAKKAPHILATGVDPETAGALDLPRGGLRSGSKTLDAVVEAPLRALSAADAMWRGASYAGHAAALATRQAVKEGLTGAERAARVDHILSNLHEFSGIADDAKNLAARAVFQERRPELDPALALLKGTKARYLTDVVLPFVRTPYNVAAQGAGMTPAGFAGALKAARAGQKGEAIDRAVRAGVGTAALGYGLSLAASGYVTGATPDDAAERSALPDGWKPYSLRIPVQDGAVYVPLQMLGPVAMPLGIAGALGDLYKRGQAGADPQKLAYRSVSVLAKYVGDQAFLQGLSALPNIIDEPERYLETFTEGYASSLMPASAFQKQIDQLLGRAPRDPKGALEGFLAASPLTSPMVESRLTPLGEERRPVSGPAALLTGTRIAAERDEPTLALYRENKVGVGGPMRSAFGVPLTTEEQRRVQVRAGELLRARIGEIQGTPRLRAQLDAMSGAERADALESVRDAMRERAAEDVLTAAGVEEVRRRRGQVARAKDERAPAPVVR